METTVRRIGETLAALGDALATAWAEGAWRPEGWPPTMWVLLGALVVLLVLAAVRRSQPRPLEVRPPQLLITQGEVLPDTGPEATPRRRRRGTDPSASRAGTLTMTVSNLSRYPVQLLEVALREETRGAPRVAEVEAVVPAMGAVDVVARVPLALRGDGWIDLYCYAAAPRHKVHRHRAELVWEPWASRFKVAPMEQVAAPVRRLASDERHARFEVEEPVLPEAAMASGAEVGLPAAADERPPRPWPGSDRPTAVSRFVTGAPTVSGPASAAAERRAPAVPALDDASPPASVAAPKATASLGALWDRLPKGAERPSPSSDGEDTVGRPPAPTPPPRDREEPALAGAPGSAAAPSRAAVARAAPSPARSAPPPRVDDAPLSPTLAVNRPAGSVAPPPREPAPASREGAAPGAPLVPRTSEAGSGAPVASPRTVRPPPEVPSPGPDALPPVSVPAPARRRPRLEFPDEF